MSESRTRVRGRRLLLLLGMLALPAARAAAQDDHLLMERDRLRLHPAENPLELSGLDDGPEGFRSMSPALLASDLEVARFDPEEARRRRLSMYEEGASFSSALPVVDERGRPIRKQRPRVAPAEVPAEDSGHGGWLLPIAAVVLLGGLVALRRSPGA